MRTRAQASPHPGPGGGAPPPRGVIAGVSAALAAEPNGSWLRLWRGCGATLARDVPFSAIYWATLEPLRAALLRSSADDAAAATVAAVRAAGFEAPPAPPSSSPSRRDLLRVNVLAGGLAGGFAGAVTTPLDVAKTQLQLHPLTDGGPAGASASTRATLVGTLRRVATTQGVGGLFVGVVPRVMRAAPACAIVLASYELLKARARDASP